MATTRKGKRCIAVDGVRYYWSVRHTRYRDGIEVEIVTSDAFVHGQRGQRLTLCVDREFTRIPFEGSWGGHESPTVRVTPSVVRRAIVTGRSGQPPFTGRDGDTNIRLGLEPTTPRVHLESNLRHAGELLTKMNERDDGKKWRDFFVGIFWPIGRACVEHAELGQSVEDWFRNSAAQIVPVTPQLQGYVDAIEATLGQTWAPHKGIWGLCCARRSATEYLLGYCRAAGIESIAAAIDTTNLDRRMLTADLPKGPGSIDGFPAGMPDAHWWWKIPASSCSVEPAMGERDDATLPLRF